MNNEFEKELDGTFDGLIEYHRAVAGKRRLLIGCKQLHENFSKASSDDEEKQILKEFAEQLKKLATDVEVVLPHQYTDNDDVIRGHRMTPTESRLFEFPDPISYDPKGFEPGVIYPLKMIPLKIRDVDCIMMKNEATNNQPDSEE
jgi:hypothetical protein